MLQISAIHAGILTTLILFNKSNNRTIAEKYHYDLFSYSEYGNKCFNVKHPLDSVSNLNVVIKQPEMSRTIRGSYCRWEILRNVELICIFNCRNPMLRAQDHHITIHQSHQRLQRLHVTEITILASGSSQSWYGITFPSPFEWNIRKAIRSWCLLVR